MANRSGFKTSNEAIKLLFAPHKPIASYEPVICFIGKQAADQEARAYTEPSGGPVERYFLQVFHCQRLR